MPSRTINAPEDGLLDKDAKVHRRHTADARILQRDIDDVFKIHDLLAPAEEPLRGMVEDDTDLLASSPASSTELFKAITAALALCTTLALRINKRGKKLHVEHDYGAEVAREFDAVDPLGEKGSADNKELKKAIEKVKANCKKASSSSSRAKPASSSRKPESSRRGCDNRREGSRRASPGDAAGDRCVNGGRVDHKAEQINHAARDAHSKLYQRRYNVRKGKYGSDEEDCDAGDESGSESVEGGDNSDSAKRTLGLAVKNAKEPFAWPDIAKLVRLRCRDDSGICSWIVALAAAVSFAGFCRYNDLRVLRWKDVSFLSTYLEFRFVKHKNDQHRLCGKGGHKGELGIVPSSSPIEYPTLKRYLARWLDPLLTPAMTEAAFLTRFGTQSSRSGGASAAANADIPFATWGQHGGWKSTSAQLRYMGLDEEHVLSVSRAILTLAEEDELDDSDGDGSSPDTNSGSSHDAT
eukprot:jgi/Tetstr1/442939/TSEL_031001.t1